MTRYWCQETRLEALIDHWHKAQLMHPGRNKMQRDPEWKFECPPGYDAIRNCDWNIYVVCRVTTSPERTTAWNPVYRAFPEVPTRSVAIDVFAMPEVTVQRVNMIEFFPT